MSQSPPSKQKSSDDCGAVPPPPSGGIHFVPFVQNEKGRRTTLQGAPVFAEEVDKDQSVVVKQLNAKVARLEHELHQMTMSKEAADFRISHMHDMVPGLAEEVQQATLALSGRAESSRQTQPTSQEQQAGQTLEDTKTSGPKLTQQLLEAMQGKSASDAKAAGLEAKLKEACEEARSSNELCLTLRSEIQKKTRQASEMKKQVEGVTREADVLKKGAEEMKAKEESLIQKVKKLQERGEIYKMEQQKLFNEKIETIRETEATLDVKESTIDALRKETLRLKDEVQSCKARCDLAERKAKDQEEMLRSQRQPIEEAKQSESSELTRASDETVINDEEGDYHPLDRAKRLEWEIEEREMELADLLQSRLQRLRLPRSGSGTPLHQSRASFCSPFNKQQHSKQSIKEEEQKS